jgi:hypothetical protein
MGRSYNSPPPSASMACSGTALYMYVYIYTYIMFLTSFSTSCALISVGSRLLFRDVSQVQFTTVGLYYFTIRQRRGRVGNIPNIYLGCSGFKFLRKMAILT